MHANTPKIWRAALEDGYTFECGASPVGPVHIFRAYLSCMGARLRTGDTPPWNNPGSGAALQGP